MNTDKRRNHYVINWKKSVKAHLKSIAPKKPKPAAERALTANFPKSVVVVPPRVQNLEKPQTP